MKKTLSILLTAVILTAMLVISPTAVSKNTEDIVILYTNDVHCGVDTYLGYDALKLYQRELQSQYENVLTVDATGLQRYLVDINVNERIGKPVG